MEKQTTKKFSWTKTHDSFKNIFPLQPGVATAIEALGWQNKNTVLDIALMLTDVFSILICGLNYYKYGCTSIRIKYCYVDDGEGDVANDDGATGCFHEEFITDPMDFATHLLSFLAHLGQALNGSVVANSTPYSLYIKGCSTMIDTFFQKNNFKKIVIKQHEATPNQMPVTVKMVDMMGGFFDYFCVDGENNDGNAGEMIHHDEQNSDVTATH